MNLIIKKDKVQYEAQPERRPMGSAPGHAHGRSARLVTINGAPRAIEVSCLCGEVFVVELTFEEDSV